MAANRRVADCCRKAIDRNALEEAVKAAASLQRVELNRDAIDAVADNVERYATEVAERAARIASREKRDVCRECVSAAALDVSMSRFRA